MTLTVQHNVSLQPFNTLRVEAKAREWVEVRSQEDCAQLPALCRDKKILILGGGSNLVLAGDVNGLVIHNQLRGIECVRQDDQHVWVQVAGGENWDAFVAHAVAQGWHGCLSYIVKGHTVATIQQGDDFASQDHGLHTARAAAEAHELLHRSRAVRFIWVGGF